jgi:nicotinamidase-related amidase
MSTPNLEIPVRWFQLGKLYGPGMPQDLEEGLKERLMKKPVSEVAIVSVHCWNLGEPGAPYPFEPGTRSPGKIEDWVPRAHEIVSQRIKPTFDAARKAGITIFHLSGATYAPRYPTYKEISTDPELQAPEKPNVEFERCVRPRTKEEEMRKHYGPNWPGAAWHTHPELFDIAQGAKPLDTEPVLTNGWQLNGLCRRKGIDTLFYVGFMAEICLQHVPGAIIEMSEKFGYRCVVLRDCTTAHEYPETYEGNWMTFAAIRMIEAGVGFSTTSRQFIKAVEDAIKTAQDTVK